MTLLNFAVFEYVIPFISRKHKSIIYRILLGVFLVFIMLMLYSFGLFGWRQLGIGLGLYTPYLSVTSSRDAVSFQMQYSTSSIFFFAIGFTSFCPD